MADGEPGETFLVVDVRPGGGGARRNAPVSTVSTERRRLRRQILSQVGAAGGEVVWNRKGVVVAAFGASAGRAARAAFEVKTASAPGQVRVGLVDAAPWPPPPGRAAEAPAADAGPAEPGHPRGGRDDRRYPGAGTDRGGAGGGGAGGGGAPGGAAGPGAGARPFRPPITPRRFKAALDMNRDVPADRLRVLARTADQVSDFAPVGRVERRTVHGFSGPVDVCLIGSPVDVEPGGGWSRGAGRRGLPGRAERNWRAGPVAGGGMERRFARAATAAVAAPARVPEVRLTVADRRSPLMGRLHAAAHRLGEVAAGTGGLGARRGWEARAASAAPAPIEAVVAAVEALRRRVRETTDRPIAGFGVGTIRREQRADAPVVVKAFVRESPAPEDERWRAWHEEQWVDLPAIGRVPCAVEPIGQEIRLHGVSCGESLRREDEDAFGTLGCLVRPQGARPGGEKYGLSCAHVLAKNGLGQRGDRIYCPKDGRTAFAPLYSWVGFNVGGDNDADAALAGPLDADACSASIDGLGVIKGVAPLPALGDRVRMRGAGRGQVVTATFDDVAVRFPVPYRLDGTWKDLVFTQVALCDSNFGVPGDSGAVVVDDEDYAVGIHFAGSDIKSLFLPIEPALRRLGMELVT